MAPGDLSAIELDATLNMLYSRVQEQEHNQTNQVCFSCLLTTFHFNFLIIVDESISSKFVSLFSA